RKQPFSTNERAIRLDLRPGETLLPRNAAEVRLSRLDSFVYEISHAESRPGICAGRVRAEPGAGLAGGAFLERSAVRSRTAAVAALPERDRFPCQTDLGLSGRSPARVQREGGLDDYRHSRRVNRRRL